MSADLNQLGLTELQALFIERNRAFTTAMRSKKTHRELVAIYKEIQEVYTIIKQKKEYPFCSEPVQV